MHLHVKKFSMEIKDYQKYIFPMRSLKVALRGHPASVAGLCHFYTVRVSQ
jgi:hypothetical protein